MDGRGGSIVEQLSARFTIHDPQSTIGQESLFGPLGGDSVVNLAFGCSRVLNVSAKLTETVQHKFRLKV